MYCRTCGNELRDEAYFCPNCGCLAKEETAPAVKKKASVAEESKDKLLNLFTLLSFGLLCFSAFLIIIGFSQLEIYVNKYTGSYTYYDAEWYFGYGAFVFAFIVAIVALGLGITSFVWGLKSENSTLKTLSILCFMASVTMQISTFALLFTYH